MDYEKLRKELVEKLIKAGTLKSKEIIDAFLSIPREEFCLPAYKDKAYIDVPLPIGWGQTISQPTTVAIMTEALKPKEDSRILEVGTGSGYQAAILAFIAKNGFVYTIERIPQLAKFAERNLRKVGIKNVKVFIGDGSLGLKEYAPFDRIIVTCCCPKIPPPLLEQLAKGGIMVLPVGDHPMYQRMTVIEKRDEGDLRMYEIGFFSFVPLIGIYGFKSDSF